MILNDKPNNPDDAKYDFIIKYRISGLFYGIKNEYLIELLSEINIKVDVIQGENELLEKCDCCNYRTISPGEDGCCEICTICFWENFGEGPNGITLIQAKKNFKIYGAMSERALEWINPNGKRMYEK